MTNSKRQSFLRTSNMSLPLLGVDAFFGDEEVDELFGNIRALLDFDEVEEELQQSPGLPKRRALRGKFALGALILFLPLSLFFSSFLLLIPLIHGVGGFLLHNKEGWRFYQPGKGGVRFVALNSCGWIFYVIALLLRGSHLLLGEFFLSFSAFISGLLSVSFMICSLFAFKGTVSSEERVPDRKIDPKKVSHTFNERLQRSVLMQNGANPSGLWWVFISFQLALVTIGSWLIIALASSYANKTSIGAKLPSGFRTSVGLSTVFLAWACFAGSVPVTNAIGGKWKHYKTDFAEFQPFSGGVSFMVLQGLGWTSYAAMNILSWWSLIEISERKLPTRLLLATAATALTSQILIMTSLFHFKSNGQNNDFNGQNGKFSEILIDVALRFANWAFGPRDDWKARVRRTVLTDREAWMNGEAKFEEILAENGADLATGEQYLIVGCGFVGKRIVRRLLSRGEKRIRIFDIAPSNPFEDIPEVEYVRGDVTKIESIASACADADVVYATFALIRFMDRLPHQAAISYHVNVRGTEVLFDALRERANAKTDGSLKVIVTSSSHATTDEDSEPRRNRTEEAPYVTRKTAHNHYGWTKALADQHALEQNDPSNNLLVTVIRPCSGVFGGDDRTSLEKSIELGIIPGIGAYSEMDWVFVENIVLGHLLAEVGLRRPDFESVAGEAFNLSNNDPVTWIDFWHLVDSSCELQFQNVKERKTMRVKFFFVPMALFWGLAYFSELVQRVFRGRVSLGQDLDMITPAMMMTSTMSYTYTSDKAEAVLGYQPAYSLDEGVQKGLEEFYQLKIEKVPLF